MAKKATHQLIIEPLKGVGPIRFGMHKDAVSRAFTYVYRSFFKGPLAKVRSDHCEVVGLIIHYDDRSRVKYVEVTKPQRGSASFELFGSDVTRVSIRELAELLRANKARVKKTHYGMDCPKLGLSIFNSVVRNENDLVECIGIGPGGSSSG